MTDPSYLGLPVSEFLGQLAGPEPAPSGGGAAALAVSMGAGLCAMAARLSSRQLTETVAEDLAVTAQRTAARASALIQADADSYAAVIAAQRRRYDDAGTGRREIAAALAAAADVPMEIIELAVPVARLAARLAADGNQNLRGDAITGALLAEAGARAAAVLVGINLASATDDGRPARAGQLAKEAVAFAAEAAAQE